MSRPALSVWTQGISHPGIDADRPEARRSRALTTTHVLPALRGLAAGT